MKDRNDPGTEELCLGVPKTPANAAPERSALVTVADARNLRERSDARHPASRTLEPDPTNAAG